MPRLSTIPSRPASAPRAASLAPAGRALGLPVVLGFAALIGSGCAAHRPSAVVVPLGAVGVASPTVSLDSLSAQASVLGAISFSDREGENAAILGDALRQVDHIEVNAEAWCNTPAYDLAACSAARREQGQAWISLARAMGRAPTPAGLDAQGAADWQAGWSLLTLRVEQRGDARLQVLDEAAEANGPVASLPIEVDGSPSFATR